MTRSSPSNRHSSARRISGGASRRGTPSRSRSKRWTNHSPRSASITATPRRAACGGRERQGLESRNAGRRQGVRLRQPERRRAGDADAGEAAGAAEGDDAAEPGRADTGATQQLVEKRQELGLLPRVALALGGGDQPPVESQRRARHRRAEIEREDGLDRGGSRAKSSRRGGVYCRAVSAVAELTPMLRHYLELKARHPDALLFYRMGDFFELFFDDAIEAATLLELTLTARQRGTENEAPMCGVPHHAAEGYIGACCGSDARSRSATRWRTRRRRRGWCRREVTRIHYARHALRDGAARRQGGEPPRRPGLGGRARRGRLPRRLDRAFSSSAASPTAPRRWPSSRRCVRASSCSTQGPCRRAGRLDRARGRLPHARSAERPRSAARRGRAAASAARRRHAARFRPRRGGAGRARGGRRPRLRRGEPARRLAHVRELGVREARDRLVLDATTLANLEIFRNAARCRARPGRCSTFVDRTKTAPRRTPGARLAAPPAARPGGDRRAPGRRRGADGRRRATREPARSASARIADLERLASRAVVGSLSPREAAAVRDTLRELPALRGELAGSPSAAAGARRGRRSAAGSRSAARRAPRREPSPPRSTTAA